MDKFMFGKILGEIYRVENRLGNGYVSEAVIYGLLNGFEHVIDEEIADIGRVTIEEIKAVSEVLNVYHLDQVKLAELEGFYDVEDDLLKRGIDRVKARSILKYFKSNGQFTAVINKFDSIHSPIECKEFELNDWEK